MSFTMYNRIPVLESILAEKRECPICKYELKTKNIKFLLYNKANRPVEVGSSQMNYCTRCNIAFATSKIIRGIRDRYTDFYISILVINRNMLQSNNVETLRKKIQEKPKINSKFDTKEYERSEIKRRMNKAYNVEKTVIYIGLSGHRCNNYRPELRMIDAIMYDEEKNAHLVTMMQCPICKKVFLDKKFYNMNKNLFKMYNFFDVKKEGIANLNAKKQSILADRRVFEIERIKNNSTYTIVHKKKDKALIKTEGIKIYYEMDEPIKKKVINENGLNTVSTVKELGYSLQLGREARWKVLMDVVIPKIGKQKTIRHIKFLIKMNKGQQTKVNAVREWEYDLKRLETKD